MPISSTLIDQRLSPIDIYLDVVDWLDDNNFRFVSRVASMGAPRFSDEVPYAYTILENDMLITYINTQTMSELSITEQVFTITHELCHILFGDLKKLPKFDNPQKFNVAADCVINDFLDSIGIPCGDLDIVHGQEKVGIDCTDLTVEDVYPLIPDDPDGGCDLGDADDRMVGNNTDFFKTIANIASEEEMEELAESLAEAAKAEGEPKYTNDDRDKTKRSGHDNSYASPMKPPPLDMSVIADWDSLVDKLHKTFDRTKLVDSQRMRKANPSFHRPDSKATHLYPGIFVPSRRPSNKLGQDDGSFKPNIVVAVDSSGSINQAMIQHFLSVVAKLDRRKVNIECVTFSTYILPYDLDKPGGNIAYGGTNFDCIRRHIVDTERENDAVVVLTDGEASPPRVKVGDKFKWLFVVDTSYSWGNSQHYINNLHKNDFTTVKYRKFFD